MILDKTKYKFFICSASLSFIAALLFYCLAVYETSFTDGWITGLYVFIPAIAAVLIYYVLALLFKKFTITAKIITVIISILAILGQILVSLVIITIVAIFYEGKVYEDIKDYNKAVDTIWHTNCILHFPKSIPENAKNVRMHKCAGPIFGSEEMFLAFEADKEYIDSEIKKFKFIKTEGPFSNKVARSVIFSNLSIDEEGFKFYVIGDNSTSNTERFPLEYGIAVNHKTNQIIYYYELFD